jgi:hypothetical protein
MTGAAMVCTSLEVIQECFIGELEVHKVEKEAATQTQEYPFRSLFVLRYSMNKLKKDEGQCRRERREKRLTGKVFVFEPLKQTLYLGSVN